MVLLFLIACDPSHRTDPPPPSVDAAVDASPVTVDAASGRCDDGVRGPGEHCLEAAEILTLGPLTTLAIEDVLPARIVVGDQGGLRTASLAGADVVSLDGTAAVEVIVRNTNDTGDADIIVLGSDGSIRIHADGRVQGSGVAAPGAGRSGLDAARVIGERFEILTTRAGRIERFELGADGTSVVANSEIEGARGRFVGSLDGDEDNRPDIIVGGAEFSDGVALDSFLQADGFDEAIQAQKVPCPGGCSAAGMRVAELFAASPDDIVLHVPGAEKGDLHVYIGGGTINYFSNPQAVPAREVADFEVGNLDGQQRADLVVTSACTIAVFPGVALGDGPEVSDFLGYPIPIAAPDGHCPELVAVSDIDGDGMDEMLTASSKDAQVVVYRHNW